MKKFLEGCNVANNRLDFGGDPDPGFTDPDLDPGLI